MRLTRERFLYVMPDSESDVVIHTSDIADFAVKIAASKKLLSNLLIQTVNKGQVSIISIEKFKQ